MGFLCMPWPGTLRRLADSTGDSAADASVMRWNRAASPAAAASFGAQACTAERKSTLPTHPRHVNMLTVRVWMVHALCVQRRRDFGANLHFPKYFAKYARLAREEKFPEIYRTRDRILLFVSALYGFRVLH